MKVKRDMPLSEALEEISTVVQRLKGNGSARLNGHEIALDDPVTLEIETESGKKSAELEFEIKWPPEKSKGKGKAKSSNGKTEGGRRWFVWALTGAALGGAALFYAKRRRGSSEDAFSGEF